MNECIHCGETLAVGATRCARCHGKQTPDGTNQAVSGFLLAAFFAMPLLTGPMVMHQKGPTPGAIGVLIVGLVGVFAGAALVVTGRRRMAEWTRAAREARVARDA